MADSSEKTLDLHEAQKLNDESKSTLDVQIEKRDSLVEELLSKSEEIVSTINKSKKGSKLKSYIDRVNKIRDSVKELSLEPEKLSPKKEEQDDLSI